MHIKYSKEDKKACQRETKCYSTSLRGLVKLKDLSELLLKKRKQHVIKREGKKEKE